MKSITRILIANRGEIAVRIARTCRSMGIDVVAVYSDADADSPHVRAADVAVHIGPSPPAESYLRADAIIAAAKKTGAQAIHPGFGFLAENADFAEACAEAGVVFIGPSPDAIRAMGSKQQAKHHAVAASVPVVPGYNGEDQGDDALIKAAEDVGYPLLIKASAGGGGKGMRIVRAAAELKAGIDSARREAASSFGDDTLLIEKYIERPRHIEVQILGDQHGEVVHLFERECSIQRRYQKVIEEAPSTVLSAEQRAEMGAAAVRIAKAIGYSNAGTVEFIFAPDGAFYFLEVNTRLQVEHPITECVTGIDLVRKQIEVATGAPLGVSQSDLRIAGAALECRIYAEDPAQGFLPATGTLVDWHLPEMEGLRVDTGVETGAEVSVFYDPMIAKVITWGDDREHARRRMIYALRRLSVHGLTNNREFLLSVLEHPEYVAGNLHTHFIAEQMPSWSESPTDEQATQSAVAATLHAHLIRNASSPVLPNMRAGFRNNSHTPQKQRWMLGDDAIEVAYSVQRTGGIAVQVGDYESTVTKTELDGAALVWTEDGVCRSARVVRDGTRAFVQSLDAAICLHEEERFPVRGREVPAGGCTAPMTGRVLKVQVAVGDSVEAGNTLIILEAMKMEHAITAPESGTVAAINVDEGDLVDEGAVLLVVESAADSE